jgi:predicted SAM-dependent methyltransferase
MAELQTSKGRSNRRRFDLISAILVSLTVGFSAGKIWVRESASLSTFWSRHQASAAINTYLKDHSIRKLQLGAGPNSIPGWLNTDIEPAKGQAHLDATKRFPLPDGSFRYIFSEHLIEHLSPEDGLNMLRECYRVLEPDGTVRIETPNLLKFVALFDADKSDDVRRYEKAKLQWHSWEAFGPPECLILNLQLRSFGHRFVYDPVTLRAALRRAGFQNIREYTPGTSDDPQLRGIGYREGSAVERINDYETMVFEAHRP